jgi:hypothetical protein
MELRLPSFDLFDIDLAQTITKVAQVSPKAEWMIEIAGDSLLA